MYLPLGQESLKTGEGLEMGVVECPDPDWAPQILPFLSHKSHPTREHLRRALEGPLDSLETRFYVGAIEGRVVTQVMIVSSRGAGILGHVFTHPDHRRKGAYTHLMRCQMADMARIRVGLLCLGTGFDSAAYWIYHSFGFRSIGPRRGEMIWRQTSESEDRLFTAGPTTIRTMRWDDWPWLDLLGMQPVGKHESLPRSTILGLKEQGSLEGPFTSFHLARESGAALQALVLESAAGATVGFVLAAPDGRWFSDVSAANMYVHPGFYAGAEKLLQGITWPSGPCITYRTDPPGGAWDTSYWSEAGFHKHTVLPRWLSLRGDRADLELWLRDG